MRSLLVNVFVFMVLLLPNVGSAQGTIQPTPVPDVTAASASWYLRSEPIFFAGNLYYPTGPDVYFDGNSMTRTMIYQGVPLYADGSKAPYSVLFVPIGGRLMRPYERRTSLTGIDSGVPQAPSPAGSGASASIPQTFVPAGTVGTMTTSPQLPIGTGGTIVTTNAAPAGQPTRTTIETIPAPARGVQGVWIEYEGARWYHAGAPVSYNPDRFTPLGSYRGFPVYKDKNDSSDTVYVTVVKDGPLAPYTRK